MIENDPDYIECGLPEEGAALGLLGMIKGISEWSWCAGWMSGIEYQLWDAKPGQRIGQETLTERQATLLRLLSEECDGWWYWDKGAGPKFVRLDKWREKVAALAVPNGERNSG